LSLSLVVHLSINYELHQFTPYYAVVLISVF